MGLRATNGPPTRPHISREKRVDEFGRRERGEIVESFAHADETDGDPECLPDGDHDTALSRAVEFREDDAVGVETARELPGLLEAILPRVASSAR